MSLNRRVGLGMTLGVDTTGGTSYVTLGALVDAPEGPEAKSDHADITILGDSWKQFAKTQSDGGTVKFTFAYDPDDTTTQTLATLMASPSATAPNWAVTFPPGTQGAGTTTTESFHGFVVGLSRKAKKDNLIVADIEIKVTGDPGFHHQ